MMNKLKLKYEFKDDAVPNLKLDVIGVCGDDNYCQYVSLRINNEYLVLDQKTANNLGQRLLTLTDIK